METALKALGVKAVVGEHGSYLQGMETCIRGPTGYEHYQCTDPTYKEWKLLLGLAVS